MSDSIHDTTIDQAPTSETSNEQQQPPSLADQMTQVIDSQARRISQLESEIERQKQRYCEVRRDLRLTRFAFDKAGDAVLWISRDGSLLYADPNACRLLKADLPELQEKTIFDIDLLMSAQRWPAHWEKLKNKASLSFETRFHRDDSQEFPVEIRANYLISDSEEYNIAIFADITDRRREELERRHRETVLQYSQRFTTPFNDDSKIRSSVADVFEELAELLSLSRVWLAQLELGAWPLGNVEWSQNSKSIFQTALTSDTERQWWRSQFSSRATITGTRTDTELPSQLSKSLSAGGVHSFIAAPIQVLGSLWGYMALADQSPRQWNEHEQTLMERFSISLSRAVERREGRRKLEEGADRLETALIHAKRASSAKSEFLANMSHEFRTPMTAIVGYAQLLSRKTPSQQDQRLWANQLRQNADYLLSLVNNILDLSKIEAGELQPVLKPTSVKLMLDEVMALMAPRAAEKMLFLDVHAKTEIPAMISTDDLRVRQILVNLISNAIKYTDDGGVSVELEYRRRSKDGGDLVVTVTDTGCGISGQLMNRLFEPFTQATRTRANGTGLGLSIARRLAQMLHGDISAQSTPGNGSRFQVRMVVEPSGEETLPVGPVRFQIDSQPEQAESFPNLKGVRVLIADDSPENVRIFSYFLEEAGAKIFAASNGAEAVSEALSANNAGNDYDLILMDMLMPVLDGYEATRRLRSSGVEIPIMALTAYATAQDRDKCLEAGCDDFITKPVLPRTFLRRVAVHTKRELDGDSSHPNESTNASEDSDAGASTPTLANVFCPEALKKNPAYLELVDQYLRNLPAMMEAIRKAQESDDRATLRRLAHRLKGNAASYGFSALSEAATQLDSSLEHDPNAAELQALIDKLFVKMPNLEQR